MKIILLGYMGSGKSTVGKELATQLQLQFIDLDAYLEAKESQTIPLIFATKGEIYFRKKESQYLKELLDSEENMVLSVGGGTPCFGTNMETMLQASPNVVYLKVSLMELVDRLKREKQHRPLIREITDADLPEFIGKHLFERSYYYNQAAKVVSDEGRDPAAIANEIGTLLI